jgi:hypothetical protein
MGGSPKTRPVMCVETGEKFESVKQACEKINGNEKLMRKAANGLIKTHRGMTWRYTDDGDRRSGRYI